jgi:tetratricopeptide (TPR) repeat protein
VVLGNIGQHDEAIEVRRNILKTVPNHPMALSGLRASYYEKGMYEEAFEADKTRLTASGDPEAVEALEHGYAEGGYQRAMSRVAERMVAKTRTAYVKPTDIAGLYRDAGRSQEALDWLERAFEERDPDMPYIGVFWKGFRDEPRYQSLLRRMNFPEDVLTGYLNEAQ